MAAPSAPAPPPALDSREKRVINPRPHAHYRKTYSLTEVRIGGAVLLVLVAIASWVAWRGAHPDPLLYGDPNAVLKIAPGGPVDVREGGQARVPGPGGAAASNPIKPIKAVDRGPLPASLATTGFTEGQASRFEAGNLYEKINGRADFFLSRGFKSMTFVPLTGAGGETVDLELYDLGSPENALSAFSAEKPPEEKATSAAGSSGYRARNALFVARGPFYGRAIGSDESAPVLAQLEAVRKALETGVASGDRPWAHALFADALGIPPDRVTYQAENAFSFAFGKNVFSALLPDGETEVFVMPLASAKSAESTAKQFEKAFLDYGDVVDRSGAKWVKDKYLSGYSRAVAAGTMVAGVKGAPKIEDAEALLGKLSKAVSVLPASVAEKAARGPEKAKGGGYE